MHLVGGIIVSLLQLCCSCAVFELLKTTHSLNQCLGFWWELTELDLSTRGVIDQWIHKVFIDPGRHSLATICSSVSADIYYIHGKWKKPCVISRLKGMTVSSVAWNCQQINEAFTQEVILGTTNDQLYETTIEERQKGEISEAPV
jgi:hypothetical protein